MMNKDFGLMVMAGENLIILRKSFSNNTLYNKPSPPNILSYEYEFGFPPDL
jgi:hypothetical protein